jgi:predicted amidohydrolase
MESAVKVASQGGSEILVFPEMAYFSAPAAQAKTTVKDFSRLMELFASWASKYKVCLLPGSLREPGPRGLCYNTLPVFSPNGELLAKYRKILLFRARLGAKSYDESASTAAGREAITFRFRDVTFGLAICYDLRFPELFRTLKKKGAEAVFLPSAFTVPTGKAHWETLLRARAIENQLFVAAPGQCGRSGNGSLTYGHSLVVDPWGKVAVRSQSRPKALSFHFKKALAGECALKLDPWRSRREDLFPIG